MLIFQTLSNYLGPERPIYALQPPGLEDKEPFLTRIEDIASHYLLKIKAIQPAGPYYLAGYSFGGIVTFEMAHQLHAAGEDVGLLVLLDCKLRFWERVRPSMGLTERWKHCKSRLKRVFGKSDGDGLAYLRERIRYNSHRALLRVFQAVGKPLPRLLGTIEDVNWFAAANYKPQVYPDRLTLIRCSERTIWEDDDDLLGWRGLAAGIDVKETPGNHLTITVEPNVPHLAETLRLCIQEAQARTNEVARLSVGS